MFQVVAARGWTDSVGPKIFFVLPLINHHRTYWSKYLSDESSELTERVYCPIQGISYHVLPSPQSKLGRPVGQERLAQVTMTIVMLAMKMLKMVIRMMTY